MGEIKELFSLIKLLNKKINFVFVVVLLTAFYLAVVGLSSILYRITKLFEKNEKDTFWVKTRTLKKKDFLSSY